MPKKMESLPDPDDNFEKENLNSDSKENHKPSEDVIKFQEELKEEITPDALTEAVKQVKRQFELEEEFKRNPEIEKLQKAHENLLKEIEDLHLRIGELEEKSLGYKVVGKIKSIFGFKSEIMEKQKLLLERESEMDEILRKLWDALKKAERNIN